MRYEKMQKIVCLKLSDSSHSCECIERHQRADKLDMLKLVYLFIFQIRIHIPILIKGNV